MEETAKETATSKPKDRRDGDAHDAPTKGASKALKAFRQTGHLPSGFVYDSRWPEKVRSVAKAKQSE